MALPKHLRAAGKTAKSLGWRIEERSSGHAMWFPPDKSVSPVTTSTTPGSSARERCDLSLLRRSGLPV